MSGPSRSSTESATDITNVDERFAVQDGLGLSDSNITGNISFNSTSAIENIANMATATVTNASNNVAELTGYAIDRNLDSLDNTINRSVDLVDGVIARTYQNQQAGLQLAAEATADAQRVSAASRFDEAQLSYKNAREERDLVGRQQDAINKLAADNTKLGFGLADVAVKAFSPTDNKALDSIKTMGMVAAAAVAAVFIFRSKS